MKIETPWLASYGNIPHSLNYPDCSMAELVFNAAFEHPNVKAYEFSGCTKTHKDFVDEILLCSRGLKASGINKNDRVTICMPNTPQAIIMFYALNHIGAIANMVHPLSAEEELVRYIEDSKSVAVFTLDQFSEKLLNILPRTDAKQLILTGIEDSLSGIKRFLYKYTKGRKIVHFPTKDNILRYNDLLQNGSKYDGEFDAAGVGNDVAAILYSGGTSGTNKGIVLTNLNFNALAMQTIAAGDCVESDRKMLAIMPLFHGFGLGVCVHTTLISGATIILVPQFSIKTYLKLLKKTKPHYIAGVPTLYEAMLKLDNVETLDLSQLKGLFSGGDTLTVELKRKVDTFLKERGSSEQVREGYGLTECVTASCLTPRNYHKEGSIGIPYPDMLYKIVKPNTGESLPYGEEGEIVISGPTVMKCYDNNEEETTQTLKTHADGKTWLHTGDLGIIDEEGFIYFRQRMKRMIVSAGYSIYPTQLENAIESHENVLISCVIGIPDEYKKQRIKAFITLRDNQEPTDEIKESIRLHCIKNIAKYAMPSEFEYRKDLPRTLVGKVAYLELEKEIVNNVK
ncbi:MAG: AMP-binding protein [Oscillospiraceae bacterium]|jgi:long-chain acyl-CoA synthetase|nr:AMP-binding protein [Oscillospiraceae bacterium]